MNKILCRKLKSHYFDRWAVMKHNRRCTEKILLLEDAMVIKDLKPGRTLMLGCLGEIFIGLVENLDLEPQGRYDNIVMINNFEFKYLDPDKLYELINSIADKHLKSDGKMFCTCNHRYLPYDRVNSTVESAFGNWKHKKFKLTKIKVMLEKARLSFGDIWLYLQYE